MDIDKKLKEFEDEFGFKDKAAYGVFLPDGIVTAMNNYYDKVKEWVKEALEEAYQEGWDNGYHDRGECGDVSNKELVESIFKLSDCCGAHTSVSGEGTTYYYVCSKCGKACDVKD